MANATYTLKRLDPATCDAGEGIGDMKKGDTREGLTERQVARFTRNYPWGESKPIAAPGWAVTPEKKTTKPKPRKGTKEE